MSTAVSPKIEVVSATNLMSQTRSAFLLRITTERHWKGFDVIVVGAFHPGRFSVHDVLLVSYEEGQTSYRYQLSQLEKVGSFFDLPDQERLALEDLAQAIFAYQTGKGG